MGAALHRLIRSERAEADHGRLNEEIAALIKGMLARGDRQSDIAACFGINSGRVSEINTGELYPDVPAALPESLPPRDLPSPYETLKAKQEIWRVRVALEEVEEAVQRAMVAVRKVEHR